MMSMVTRNKGNAQMPRPTIPVAEMPMPTVPTAQQALHPAAQAAAVQWSTMCEENDRLRSQVQRLESDLEVSRRVDVEKDRMLEEARERLVMISDHADQRVAQAERNCRDRIDRMEVQTERYRRFSVQISTRLQVAGEQIRSAHECAVEVANEKVDHSVVENAATQVERELQELIAADVKEQESR